LLRNLGSLLATEYQTAGACPLTPVNFPSKFSMLSRCEAQARHQEMPDFKLGGFYEVDLLFDG